VSSSLGQNAKWKVPRRRVSLEGQVYDSIDEYVSRRPTYYRVLDNEKDPVE
jgi:hypothetical protein